MLGAAFLLFRFAAIEDFYFAKLFVGYAEHSYFSVFRHGVLYSFDVDIGIFFARTMSHIDRELEHGKTVFQSVLRNLAAAALSFLVSVGKSKSTITHIILYSLNLCIGYIVGYIIFLASPE